MRFGACSRLSAPVISRPCGMRTPQALCQNSPLRPCLRQHSNVKTISHLPLPAELQNALARNAHGLVLPSARQLSALHCLDQRSSCEQLRHQFSHLKASLQTSHLRSHSIISSPLHALLSQADIATCQHNASHVRIGARQLYANGGALEQSQRRYGIRARAIAGDEGAVALEAPPQPAQALSGVEGEGSAANGPGEAKPPVRKRVVSGIQPTGSIHLGNYLGAIKNWVPLQDTCDTLYFIVDLHAITMPHDPAELLQSTKTAAAIYLASGVDPAKASIFVQSHVKAHAELTWLLSCTTPISWLNKMIQFKEKARKAGEDVGTGLLTYPILMASDILLYQCDVVPVGEDQRQHLELTRDVANRINHLYGGKKWKKRGGRGGRVFKVPEIMIPPAGARVMSLTDGASKMSKSAPNDASRINLLDTPDEIANKVKRCKTDSFTGMEFDNPERPECSNLLTIYQLVTGKTKEEVGTDVKDLNWGQFKPLLADALVAHLEPVQKRYADIVAEPAYVDRVLAEGAANANEIANQTLKDVYDALGFLPPKRSF